MNQYPGFTSEDIKEIYPYRYIYKDRKLAVTYMPVIEAKELYDIATSNRNPVFLTYRDNLDVIAHSVRKEALYFDLDTGKLFGKGDALIYDVSGNIKGLSILESFLKSQGLTWGNRNERYRLPEAFNMSFNEFYNAVARGELDLNVIFPKIDTVPLTVKKRFYSKRVIMSFSVSKAISENIRAEAKEQGVTVSRLITKAMSAYLSK